MKFSLQWLQKLVNIKSNPEQLSAQLTDAGLEVESFENGIFDISVPANRADCLGMLGLARDVAAINGIDFKAPRIKAVAPIIKDKIPVTVRDSGACPRYMGRVIKNIDNSKQTPEWIRDCLLAAEIKTISPVVDITNYVMLEWGQPLHAFDLQKISGEIVVRHAIKGEQLGLLDDTKRDLTETTLVIADSDKPLALAGIMGGKYSSITSDTKDILLECAYFEPIAVRLTARHLGIKTDSCYRFERGIDPTMQQDVMEHLTQMILDIVGGEPGPVVEFKDEKQLPKPVVLTLRSERVAKILGIALLPKQINKIFEQLGMSVKSLDDGKTFLVDVPAFRTDITREIDLIEELVRIYGFVNVPEQATASTLDFKPQPEGIITEPQIYACLANRGYNEAITYSFIDAGYAKQFLASINEDLCLTNPISAEMGLMRPSLIPGLIKTVQYNQNRQQERIRLFEVGLRFVEDSLNLQQTKTIAGVCYGPAAPEGWANSKRLVDFYDAKADVEALFNLGHNGARLSFSPITDIAMHPGQAAQILLDGKAVGKIGALHPELQRSLGLPNPVYMFEIDYVAVAKGKIASFAMFSKYPAVRRDIALLVARDVSSAQLQNAIKQVAGNLLTDLVVFDVYQGKGIPENQKSMALGLTLQNVERTLTDNEVNDLFANVLNMLQREFSATLR
jgi:phenylalanyl-tRNA synthetase beta chain